MPGSGFSSFYGTSHAFFLRDLAVLEVLWKTICSIKSELLFSMLSICSQECKQENSMLLHAAPPRQANSVQQSNMNGPMLHKQLETTASEAGISRGMTNGESELEQSYFNNFVEPEEAHNLNPNSSKLHKAIMSLCNLMTHAEHLAETEQGQTLTISGLVGQTQV